MHDFITLPGGKRANERPETTQFQAVRNKYAVYFFARYKKVTIWPRVQAPSGLKVFSPVPEVMPCLATQATA